MACKKLKLKEILGEPLKIIRFIFSSVGYCEVYKRDLCLGSFNKTMLKYKDTPRFVDSRLGIEKTEEIVEKFIGIVDRMESKDEWCVGIIRSLICQYAFLPCNAQGLPIRTCREDCEVLFRDCDKPMSQVMGAAQYLFGHDKVQFFHIGLPNCTKLNYERELVNKTCVHFGVFGKVIYHVYVNLLAFI